MYGMIGLVAGGLIRLIPGEDSFSSRTAANVALLCVLGPVSEEIVYRGLVFDAAEKMKGFVFALVISTLLFACGHRMLLQMAISVPVGLALGMIREKEGNLLTPIVFHSMLNVAALILSARMGS